MGNASCQQALISEYFAILFFSTLQCYPLILLICDSDKISVIADEVIGDGEGNGRRGWGGAGQIWVMSNR